MMRKLLTALVACLLAFFCAGCASDAPLLTEQVEPTAPDAETEVVPGEGVVLAMIPESSTVADEAFQQSVWQGVRRYGEKYDLLHEVYIPTESTDAAYLEAIAAAVQNGAQVIVTAGSLFGNAVFEAQSLYPKVCFVTIDCAPISTATNETKVGDNVYSVFYREEQAGFLAGYAAVMDGYTELGFIGGLPVPGVVRYGIGYIQGVSAAAQELAEPVNLLYKYSGLFVEDPLVQTLAGSWYINGTELIFACGGGISSSICAAAEAAGADVIGVDVDQYELSETVLTSAIKELGKTVYEAIELYYKGKFPGGQQVTLGMMGGHVGLAMTNARFSQFTAEDYDTLCEQVLNNQFQISDDINADLEALAGEMVTLTIVK